MFFSNDILTRKGGQFSVVWLVGNFNTAHGSKRLGLKKGDYVAVDVVKACEDMLHPRTQFALRLSSTLLAGIIRIYQKQIHIVYDDVKAMWIFLKKGSFFRPADVELQGSGKNETFAIQDPLCYYNKDIGDERSDIRFYTSLGEKALFEAHKPVEGHESRSDSAYFTISFDQNAPTETSADFENTMIEVREEPAKKRRRISTKENLLDIIDETTEHTFKEKSDITDIQVPDETDFGMAVDEPARPDMLFDITEDQLDQTYADAIRDPVAKDMLGNISGIDTNILEAMTDNIADLTETDLHMQLDAIPEMKSFNFSFQNRLPSLLDENEQQFMPEEHAQQLETNSQTADLTIETAQPEVPVMMDTNDDSGLSAPDITTGAGDVTTGAGDVTTDQTTEEGQTNFLQEMVLKELANRIENDPMLKEMSGEVNNDKENQDPNAQEVRRSGRQKQPVTVQKPATEKAFDESLGDFTLPAATPTAPNKRKRKRQLIVDKKTQMSVKEMKKFMKKSREHLCVTPGLVHEIVPTVAALFAEPHRAFFKQVPELHGLWKRCAHSGTHDLMELLHNQEEMDELEKGRRSSPLDEEGPSTSSRRQSEVSEREAGRFERSRRDSAMSEIEVGRLSKSNADYSKDRQSLDYSDVQDFQEGANFRTSTMLKPPRGSQELAMVSPIRHGRDGSELNLGPLDFIMEESTILEQPSELEPLPDVPSNLQDSIEQLRLDEQPMETTMDYIQPLPDISEVSGYQSEVAGPSGLQDLTLGDMPSDIIQPDELNPLQDMTLIEEEPEQPLSPHKPRTPLVERLSGIPVEQESTIWTEEGEKTFAHLESQKFYKFLKRKIGAKASKFTFDDIVPVTHTSKTAALAFYQLLLLKKYEHVQVAQDDTTDYGQITIKLS